MDTETASKPNIVFILTDQQRYDSLGCTGADYAKTPRLDRLAKEGVCFDNHFVVNPVCSPSRGAIFSGRMPRDNGLWCNGCRLPLDTETLPRMLKRVGYRTGHFGKLHLEPIVKRTKPAYDYGFDTCLIGEGDQHLLHDDYNMWLREQDPRQFSEYWNQHFAEGHGKAYTALLPEERTLTHWATDQAIEWLRNDEREKDQPFFLSVGYFAPHHPFNPPEPYASAFRDAAIPPPVVLESEYETKPKYYSEFRESVGLSDLPEGRIDAIRGAYCGLVAQIDVNVGRLLDELEEMGATKNTVVVFSSDHGEFLGERGLLWKGPFMVDDLMKVPMIARWPGRLEAGIRSKSLSSALDFYATFGALAGINTKEFAPDSRPMFGMDGDLYPEGERDCVFFEWEHFSEKGNNSLRGARSLNCKYIEYAHDSESGEIYDLVVDPGERENLWNGESSDEAARLRSLIAENCRPGFRPDVEYEGAW